MAASKLGALFELRLAHTAILPSLVSVARAPHELADAVVRVAMPEALVGARHGLRSSARVVLSVPALVLHMFYDIWGKVSLRCARV